MASNIPKQSRAVDPFASYNSNIVNTLTRMVTYGEDGLANANSCDVEILTSNTLKLKPGFIYKDDVWINITEDYIIDFTNSEHFYNNKVFNMAGTYYIVLEYVYVKSRPAPQAKILILHPDDTSSFTPGGDWFFLKAAEATYVAPGPSVIDSVQDWDSADYDNKRRYISNYSGTNGFLEWFDADKDVSKIVYSKQDDNFYFGRADKWEPLRINAEGASFIADTRGFAIGDLIYMNFSELPYKADARNAYIFSDGVVTTIAEEGIVKTNGMVENVQVETGNNPVAGNLMYLSKTERGKVTTDQTLPIKQFVGRCLRVTAPGVIELIYHRGQADEDSDFYYGCDIGAATLDSSSWIIGPGGYFQDVDISTVQQKNIVVTTWDATSELEIVPKEIEFIDNSTMRVWLTTNTREIRVFLMGASNICVGAESIILNKSLSSGNWVQEDGIPYPGSEPGTFFYQNIDITDLDGKEANVLIKDNVTNLQLTDMYVQFDSTSNLRIWTLDDTDDVEVVVLASKNPLSTTPSNRVISFSSVLPNYSWNFWTDANLDIEVVGSANWGPSATGANWSPDALSTVWGGGADATASSIFEGLYYQDIDISFYQDNAMVLEFYNRSNNKVLQPNYVEFLTQDIIRIWMDSNTYNLNFTILGRFS